MTTKKEKIYPEYVVCNKCKVTTKRSLMRLYPNGVMKHRICKRCRLSAWMGYLEAKGSINGQRFYFKYKKKFCETCGFIGDACQLDVDHIDGNHKNNDPINLQTLCANCHRLKTRLNKDGIHRVKT